MSLYTDFWKKRLKEVSGKIDSQQSAEFDIAVPDLVSIGDRGKAGYNGKLTTFAGTLLSRTNSAVMRHLQDVIDNDSQFNSRFPGELVIRIVNNDTMQVKYTPITLDLLIRRYATIQDDEKVTREIFKWKLVQKFQLLWQQYSSGSISFADFFRQIDFSILVYGPVRAVYNHLLREVPDQFAALIQILYDETRDLRERVKAYTDGFKNLYYRLPGAGKNHFQDELTIATLLTFRYPEKYTFYKNSFYSKLIRGLGLKPQPTGENIYQYYSIVKELLDNHLPAYPEIVRKKNERLTADCYQDQHNLILAQDILYKTLEQKPEELTDEPPAPTPTSTVKPPLNQILYGPPGTGKTYHTINKALELTGENLEGQSRETIKQRFEQKVKDGQIVFTTFHQSMSYEDFVEGIKPLKPEDDDEFVRYDVRPGLFKLICDQARKIDVKKSKVNWDNADYYKMSLGGKDRPDIHDWCIANNVIAIGYGGDEDLSAFAHIQNWKDYRDAFSKQFPGLVKETRYHIQAMYTFQHMRINDVVIVSKGNHIIDAIGIVKSNYQWSDNNTVGYFHFRQVEWIATNMNVAPERFLHKQVSQMTIYGIDKNDLKTDAFTSLTESASNGPAKPHVLIIDEINRGNVSQIFGELITLLEEDKRLGRREALEVILPYSQKTFGVPDNLYILGTMNTADRSVEALDTALRRRFVFQEMMPQPSLLHPKQLLCAFWNDPQHIDIDEKEWLKEPYVSKTAGFYQLIGMDRTTESLILQTESDEPERLLWKVSDLDMVDDAVFKGIRLDRLLTVINKRIELLTNRDYQIGHAFFIHVLTFDALKAVLYEKVIPQLQEYFYGDYGKIGLVLGKGFVRLKQNGQPDDLFADFDYEDRDALMKPLYEIVPRDEIDIHDALLQLQ